MEWPGEPRGFSRADRNARYRRVQLELDVEHERYRPEPVSLLAPLTSLLHEREVEDAEDLLTMTAQVLRAFSGVGFRRVDHWEARPGGWLPLPEATHGRLVEPVSHLLKALSSDAWAPVGSAHSFAVRLSGPEPLRADLVVRRLHRERTHALSLDLWGPVPRRAVEDLVVRVHDRLPLLRAKVVSAEPWKTGSSRARRR
ncbi:MAG TPA: hypothetical protein VN842_04785 [Thermoplasmata archaeon]|nr:hypothetical protein [Thermoplasmata archaeon]